MSERPERLRRLLKPRRVVFIGGGGLTDAIAYTRANGFPGVLRALDQRNRRWARWGKSPPARSAAPTPYPRRWKNSR